MDLVSYSLLPLSSLHWLFDLCQQLYDQLEQLVERINVRLNFVEVMVELETDAELNCFVI